MGGTMTIQTMLESSRVEWDVVCAYGIMKERPNEKNKMSPRFLNESIHNLPFSEMGPGSSPRSNKNQYLKITHVQTRKNLCN
jgi:hypothetical protein